MTTKDIHAGPENFKAVAAAIDVLAAIREVTNELQGQFIDLSGKIICLTDEGCLALHTDKYKHEYQRERSEADLRASSLSTNRLTRLVAWISIPAVVFNPCC